MEEVFIKNFPLLTIHELETYSEIWQRTRNGKLKEKVLCALINEKLNRYEKSY